MEDELPRHGPHSHYEWGTRVADPSQDNFAPAPGDWVAGIGWAGIAPCVSPFSSLCFPPAGPVLGPPETTCLSDVSPHMVGPLETHTLRPVSPQDVGMGNVGSGSGFGPPQTDCAPVASTPIIGLPETQSIIPVSPHLQLNELNHRGGKQIYMRPC